MAGPASQPALKELLKFWTNLCRKTDETKILIDNHNARGQTGAYLALTHHLNTLHRWIITEHILNSVTSLNQEIQMTYPIINVPKETSCNGPFLEFGEYDAHKKVVVGIECIDDRLYSCSKDGVCRTWCTHSGKLLQDMDIGCEIGAMTSSGNWLFIGLTNYVKCCNLKHNLEVNLNAVGGKVFSLVAGTEYLFAGTKDGTVLSWKYVNHVFTAENIVRGHSSAVVSLGGQSNWLFTAGMDSFLKVWKANTLECQNTFQPHRSFITSLCCFENYLVTGSLDKTAKLWMVLDDGGLQQIRNIQLDQGILSLKTFFDPSGNATLVCACNDSYLQVYDLPSFSFKGWMRSRKVVRTMCTVVSGGNPLFVTGDSGGKMKVWKWLTTPVADDLWS